MSTQSAHDGSAPAVTVARRSFLKVALGAGATVLVAACGPATQPAPAGTVPAGTAAPSAKSSGGSEELVVTSYGGTFEENWRKNIIAPFEQQTGATVTVVTGLSLQILAKMRAEKGSPQMDVVTMDTLGAVPAVQEGLYERLDPARIPSLGEMSDWALEKGGNYVSFLTAYEGLAYNTDKVKEPPASWEDLWKPEYKGHVLFPDISTVHAIYALQTLAKMTGGDLNTDTVDSAFQKLASLKPSIVTFWTSHDQAAQLLNQGEAWLTPWSSDRALTQKASKAPIAMTIPKEGATFFTSEMGISKGTKHKELAEKYVSFSLSAESQQRMADTNFSGPTNKNVQLPPDQAKDLGLAPEQQAGRISVDWDKIAALRDGWTERWNREIG